MTIERSEFPVEVDAQALAVLDRRDRVDREPAELYVEIRGEGVAAADFTPLEVGHLRLWAGTEARPVVLRVGGVHGERLNVRKEVADHPVVRLLELAEHRG